MNYKKLLEDNKAGLISKDMIIVMDNDCGYWACRNWDLTEEEAEKMKDEYKKKYGNPGGPDDIVDLLLDLGINAKWC